MAVEHRSFCRFCSALCGILVTVEGDRVVRVTGDPTHPVSEGYTCVKGRALGSFHHDPGRLDIPLLGRAGPDRREVGWDEAMSDLAGRLEAVIAGGGPDSVAAFFGNAVFYDAAGARLSRKLMDRLGSRSVYSAATVDAPSRPYVAELVTGHPLTFGRAIDIDRATLTILIGLNPLVSHGHNSGWSNPRRRLRLLRERGQVWVADPRRTETAAAADHHLAPRPGTDHVWLAAIIRELLSRDVDLADLRRRATGVDELVAAIDGTTLDDAVRVTGLDRADLDALLEAVRAHGRIAVLGGTGVSMTPAANLTEWLIWVLLIITGSIDAPGGVWVNPGFLRSLDRRHWDAGDAVPGAGPASRPDLPRRLGELPAAALVAEIESGHVRALLVIGGNPVTSLPDTSRLTKALAGLDVLATIDVVHTASTDLSTHVLPTAGQLERADLPAALDINYPAVATQYTDRVVDPPPGRRPTWRLVAELAERLGVPILPDGLDARTSTDDDVLAPIAAGGRASFSELRQAGGCVVDAPSVFGWLPGAVLPGGRYRLAPAELLAQLAGATRPAPADSETLLLVPRRQLAHLNSQLVAREDRRTQPLLLINPADASRRAIGPGAPVSVVSATGSLRAVAALDEGIASGTVSLPHGYEGTNVNLLTSGAELDALTGMVTYSGVRVDVRPLPEAGNDPGEAGGMG